MNVSLRTTLLIVAAGVLVAAGTRDIWSSEPSSDAKSFTRITPQEIVPAPPPGPQRPSQN